MPGKGEEPGPPEPFPLEVIQHKKQSAEPSHRSKGDGTPKKNPIISTPTILLSKNKTSLAVSKHNRQNSNLLFVPYEMPEDKNQPNISYSDKALSPMSKVQNQLNNQSSAASQGKVMETSTFNGAIIFGDQTRDEPDEVQQFTTSLEKIGHPRFTTNAQVSASILSS